MKTLPSLAASALMLSLAGCTSDTGTLSARFNPSLYSVHQPVVQRTDYALDLIAQAGLSQGETQRLREWLDVLQVGDGDRLFVDGADAGTRAAVSDIAAGYGLLLDEGVPVSPAGPPSGSTRVVVSRAVASVSGCPNWDNAPFPGAPISTDSNYGCATNSNLAAMIADPNDLIRGRSTDPVADPFVAAKAIKVYRDRPQTGAAGTLARETQQ